MNACACMGPQGSDPVCPCRMKSGDIPGQQWVRFKQLESDPVKNIEPSPAPVQPDAVIPASVQPQAEPVAAPGQANIGTAPAFLNTNDKAFWILGWNECRDAAMKGTL